jgi:hypothetical protein
MSVHAGTIIHVGGNNVIDRVQSAGLGDVRVPTEVIREVGNEEVVDKVPGEPDFTFTLESFDTSTELEAWLTGKVGGTGSASAPGAADPDGTVYNWRDCGFLNVPSPWKDPTTGSAGAVTAGHLVPGFYPTRVRYRFGVTDNATQEVELAGGSYYYAAAAPVEQFETGDGATTAFPTDEPAVGYRRGGAEGTTFRRVFGMIVNGEIQVEGVDYVETGAPANATAATVTVTFTTAPPAGADIRFAYFTDQPHSYPQSVHASTITKPGAVRGRNICVFLGAGAQRAKLGSVQSFELEATVEGEVEREFCNEEPVGRTINGRDCNGTVTVRSKNADAFLSVVSKVTGVAPDEVIGWLNLNAIALEVQIQNPKNPGEVLKTLYVDDAIFQVPGTPARVNTPTDFEFRFESRSGTFEAIKGEKV